jgi:hypothetical protein
MSRILAIGEDSPGVTQLLVNLVEIALPPGTDDNINAIKEQTDRLIFDISNNVQTSNPFPTGIVVQDDINEYLTFMTDLEETEDDYWVGAYLKFTSGNVINQVKKILSYNGSTKVLTFYSAFSGAPEAGSQFKIVNE